MCSLLLIANNNHRSLISENPAPDVDVFSSGMVARNDVVQALEALVHDSEAKHILSPRPAGPGAKHRGLSPGDAQPCCAS